MDKHIATPEHVALWGAIKLFREARNIEQMMRVVPVVEDAIRAQLAARDAEIERLREHLTVIAECENVEYCELCRDRAKIAVREARDGVS